MPAIPAWPPKSLPRLFVRQTLSDGANVPLDSAQVNYLGNVLRLGEGAELLLFDGSSGEWLARISAAGRKRMTLTGPEGGFTDDERATIRAAPNAVAVSLGPRILRAETAALAVLAVYMAIAGDWRL